MLNIIMIRDKKKKKRKGTVFYHTGGVSIGSGKNHTALLGLRKCKYCLLMMMMMMMRIGIIHSRFGASKVINQLNCRFQSIRVMTMVMMKRIYVDLWVT